LRRNFDSKEGLITAIATHIVDDYAQRLRADRRSRVGLAGLIESLIFYIESGRSHLVQLRAFHAVLGAALNHASLSATIAELNRFAVDAIARIIASGIKRREIRSNIDSHAAAVLILSALRGVMLQWLLDPEQVDLDVIKKEFLDSLHRSLSV